MGESKRSAPLPQGGSNPWWCIHAPGLPVGSAPAAHILPCLASSPAPACLPHSHPSDSTSYISPRHSKLSLCSEGSEQPLPPLNSHGILLFIFTPSSTHCPTAADCPISLLGSKLLKGTVWILLIPCIPSAHTVPVHGGYSVNAC